MPKRDFAHVCPDTSQLFRANRKVYPPFNTREWKFKEPLVNYSLMRTIDILFEREQAENPLIDDADGYLRPIETLLYVADNTPGQFKFRGLV